MYRFYCPSLPDGALSDTLASLDAPQTHHAKEVLRLNLGDQVEVFDGQGQLGIAALKSWGDRRADRAGPKAQVRLLTLRQVDPPCPCIDVATAIPKGPTAVDMVKALNQLGADRMIPLRTQRTVTDPRPAKLERFARAAVESARQSRRAHLIKMEEPAEFESVLSNAYDLRLIATPDGQAPQSLNRQLREAKHVLLLIGPEGGWTDTELSIALKAGCVPWWLGQHVLRIEIAATAAVAIARYLARS